MKIMIVDDEENIRLGIAEGFDWDELGLEVAALAEDGKEALELALLHRPDIILLDINMPRMSGLEFMKASKENLPDAVFIILSGYDEFQYAQEAIQLGVNEYLLKPISPRELSEAVQKAVLRVREQTDQTNFIQKLEKNIEEAMPLLREKLVSDLLHQRYSPSDVDRRMEYTGIRFPSSKFAVLHIGLEQFLTRPGTEEANRQLSLFAVRNVCDEVLNREHWGVSVVALENTLEVLVSLNEGDPEPADLKKVCLELAADIKDNIKRYLNLSVSIGIGNVYSGIEQIHYSCKEAHAAIRLSAVLGKSKLIDASSLELPPSSDQAVGYAYEKELLWGQYLRNGDERALDVLDEWFDASGESGSDQAYAMMKSTVQQLLLTASKIFSALNLSLLDTGYDELYDKLHTYSDSIRLRDALRSFAEISLERINRSKSTSYRKEIEQVRSYIDERFGEEISLQRLSTEVYMNTNYLCTLFKSEVGETIHQYITRVRMDKAKQLLQQTDLKIFEVSEIVGFSNTSHFSQAFKKYTGYSPVDYKSEH
ncbi:response regulator [Cohnella endophytica]|uniref:Response regulator n=1 Tax=Cohnella endophytica TaxID=2419778 RepID=A0A494XR89_9BACL|nr:response regulator [Cohnella endophytica]RKP51356.1 response regulator [Cohnella endophytica]